MSITRWRSSMLLLAICVVAVVVSFLRVLLQPTPQPPGSSYSAQPDGTLALYTWLTALGAQPTRNTSDTPTHALFLIQPNTSSADTINAIADRGGTVILAGDTISWLLTARALGVTVDPSGQQQRTTLTSPDGLQIPFASRFRLRADAAQSLLTYPDGSAAALRMPYRQGTLIVVASAEPLTNAGLANQDTARFVFRMIAAPLPPQAVVAFDETGRTPATQTSTTTNLNQLLFQTPPGLAIVYVALLTFAFLFLTGRRLGPAVIARSAAESQRSMYEHVQMLADLYRRAAQLATVRANLSRHYSRQLARSAHPAYSAALSELETATTESAVLAAIRTLDEIAASRA